MVDELPLYQMSYHGDYNRDFDFSSQDSDASNVFAGSRPKWACSLFVSHGDSSNGIYGRNFDWYDHPAIVLWTDPSDGYASISMVDVSYLGYSLDDDKFNSVEGRENLLLAPLLPFDGMNEHGLTVGMAAVGDTVLPRHKDKPDTGGLGIIRRMLDGARNVDEALAIFDQYNIVFEGGPHIHYLIADAEGNSALIELLDGETSIHHNDGNWQSATNFYFTGNEKTATRQCHRFATIVRRMNDQDGKLTAADAFELLKDVAQDSTRWSVVYEMDAGIANVVTRKRFESVHTFDVAPESQAK